MNLKDILDKKNKPGTTGVVCSICGEQLNKWEEESRKGVCFACFAEQNT